MKKNTLFLLIIILTFSGFSQTRKIDSLKLVVKTTESDKTKARNYSNLAWLHISIDTEIASRYLDSSITIYNSLNDKEGYIQVQYKRAVINRNIGNYDEALKQINEFIEYKVSFGDSLSVADALFQKGVIIERKGDFQNGIKTYYRALSIYEQENESHSIGNIHNSIGILLKNFDQLDEALKSFRKAETIQLKINDKNNLGYTYNSLGTVYALKEDYNSALAYFNKSLKFNSAVNSQHAISVAHRNIGYTLLKLKKLKQALPHLNLAYVIQKKNNYKAHFLQTLIALSYLYEDQGDYEKSKSYLEEAEALKTDYSIGEQQFHKAFYEFHESQGNFKESLDHLKQYTALKDSIFNTENQNIINNLRFQYETEKKDKTILENELQLEKSQAKTHTMTILIISLLLASILLWFIFQQRQKRISQQLVAIQNEQEVRTLESLIAGEEKERLRIAKELHDGVNGDLSAIKFKLSSLLKMNNEVINESIAMIDNSCKHVRAISHNLVPPSLKDFSLIEAITNYCENMNSIHKSEISFQTVGEPIDLNKKAEVNIFRIIQELITNATKHAEANNIDVQISNRDKIILITVEDNGRGYENQKEKQLGIGLDNIKSRVQYLNANFDVVTNETGTYNTIEIDLNQIEN